MGYLQMQLMNETTETSTIGICVNIDKFYADLEDELLIRMNELGIGPQGFGGKTTALGINIETFPTHIAGLPVAVNISCHATRHKEVIL